MKAMLRGRNLTGRGARGFDSGIGGGGGAWKLSFEALISSISYVWTGEFAVVDTVDITAMFRI
jgi:hypothetical protein